MAATVESDSSIDWNGELRITGSPVGLAVADGAAGGTDALRAVRVARAFETADGARSWTIGVLDCDLCDEGVGISGGPLTLIEMAARGTDIAILQHGGTSHAEDLSVNQVRIATDVSRRTLAA